MTASVLVVDDNRSLAENLAEILEDHGYHAAVASNGSEALALADRFGFDAALIDLRMPGMDGLTLAAKLQEDAPTADYYFMSAHCDRAHEQRAGEFSREPIFDKPIDLDKLLRLIRSR